MSAPAGRPLRFLKLLIGGWIGVRAVSLVAPALWNAATPHAPAAQIAHRPVRDDGGPAGMMVLAAAQGRPPGAGAFSLHASERHPVLAGPVRPGAFGPVPGSGWQEGTADMLLQRAIGFYRPRLAGGVVDRLGRLAFAQTGEGPVAPGAGLPVAPRPAGTTPWSGAAWLLWRPEAGTGYAQAPLLGGSQAGARLDYRLASGLSLYGRVSRAFIGPSSEEGALGLAWRPGRLPVSLLAERRQRLGPGGRNGFAMLAAGGIGPRDIAPAVEVEGYAQAGVVGLPGHDGFADGKMNLGYRLTRPDTPRRLTLGASLSGSAQPGASRLDLGPELKLRLPMGAAAMRLSTEWRTRIAGDARPGNGPAITLVAQF